MIKEVKVFVPGHITGFFQIIQNENPLLKGSRGAGITLDEGVTTTCRIQDGSGRLDVTVNGKYDRFNTITKKSVDIISSRYNVNLENYDIEINHELKLKIGAGYGTSASFALGVSSALPSLLGIDITFKEAGEIAHLAEVSLSSGLGDVISEMYGGCVIRLKEGTPVNAVIDKIQITKPIYVITKTIGLLDTSTIIENPTHQMRINSSGSSLLNQLIKNPNLETFIKLSNKFSHSTQLVNCELEEIIQQLNEESIGASMAMLGNTAFALSYSPDTQVDDCIVTRLNTTGIKFLEQ
ncbi:MAG: pantoate kinase [Methanosphaera sp.]|nr:pantoate kinase [Methanosphaera sp.]